MPNAHNRQDAACIPGGMSEPATVMLDRNNPVVETDPWADGFCVFAFQPDPRRLAPSMQALPRDAVLLCIQLKEGAAFAREATGSQVPTNLRPGQCMVMDLSTGPRLTFRTLALLLFIGFERPALAKIADGAGRGSQEGYDQLRKMSGHPFQDPILRDIGACLVSTLRQDDPLGGHLLRQLVITIAARLVTLDHEAHICRRGRGGGLAGWQLRRAKEHLTRNLDGPPAYGEAARACGVSLRHFSRAFRQSMGLTPGDWLTRQRLLRAKSLMLGTVLPLARIADQCGFADLSHFTRVFHRHDNDSPGKWREAARRERGI